MARSLIADPIESDSCDGGRVVKIGGRLGSGRDGKVSEVVNADHWSRAVVKSNTTGPRLVETFSACMTQHRKADHEVSEATIRQGISDSMKFEQKLFTNNLKFFARLFPFIGGTGQSVWDGPTDSIEIDGVELGADELVWQPFATASAHDLAQGCFTPDLFRALFRDIMIQLKELSRQGIVHCDLKPGNILYVAVPGHPDRAGCFLLTDFQDILQGRNQFVDGITKEYKSVLKSQICELVFGSSLFWDSLFIDSVRSPERDHGYGDMTKEAAAEASMIYTFAITLLYIIHEVPVVLAQVFDGQLSDTLADEANPNRFRVYAEKQQEVVKVMRSLGNQFKVPDGLSEYLATECMSLTPSKRPTFDALAEKFGISLNFERDGSDPRSR